MGGHQSVHGDLEQVLVRTVERCGTIPVSGRYHRAPKSFGDDYELQSKVLGSGYNGHVHLATQKQTGASYAVKSFKLHGVGKEKREELVTECEIFLSLDHPHVARLNDVYETAQHLHLVMECMHGGELLQRVLKLKRFPEKSAAEAGRQMLLAINYIHSHHVVHRDIKLENFLYDKEDSWDLKLIDFGFSKIWDPNTKMELSCGTLSYVAPEVLRMSYTNKCDMWSFGVVVFVLLSGYMPFSGNESEQIHSIRMGTYNMNKPVWKTVSSHAIDFVKKCLVKDPDQRLSSHDALDHPWITKAQADVAGQHFLDTSTVESLQSFAQASQFRRACMSVMAWSLTNDERKRLRGAFLELDTDRSGAISLAEFKLVLEDHYHVDDEHAIAAFKAIELGHTDEIRYSEFLAAMVSSRIAMHDDLLFATFHRFDTTNSGYITSTDLRIVLGETFEGADVDNLLAEADTSNDGKISYQEFIVYLKGCDGDHSHAEAAHRVIDTELRRSADHLHYREEHRSKQHRNGQMRAKSFRGTVAHGKAANGKNAEAAKAVQPARGKQKTCCVLL